MCQWSTPVTCAASEDDANAWSRYPDSPSKTYEYAARPSCSRTRFLRPPFANAVIGSSNVYEFMSPISRKSGSPLPVGSVFSQSTSAAAAWVRVTLQLPQPSPGSGSPSQAEPFDFRWLTSTVSFRPVELSWKVWASDGRFRVVSKRGSCAAVSAFQAPTGVTEAGL